MTEHKKHKTADSNIEDSIKEPCEMASETLEKEDEDLQTKYLRLAADFQNFRRRSEKERSDIYAFANEKIVLELLDVIDNFERAMDHEWGPEEARLMEGMEMIFQQLQGILLRNHVEPIEALGQAFDPTVHDAVMTEPSDEYGSGIVTKLIKKGYTLNKKVIRPAMVVVAADCTE